MLDQLLGHPGVEEVLELRSRFGFMAFHGGSLEEMTDVVAAAAAEQAGASYYGVLQPPDLQWHIPSTQFDPAHSERLAAFVEHVEVVVAVHGYGREGYWATLLLGGSNRPLADHVGPGPPGDAAGLRDRHRPGPHPPAAARPPRQQPGEPAPVRRGAARAAAAGAGHVSPLCWDWEGPGLNPHTQALIDGLADAARTWEL